MVEFRSTTMSFMHMLPHATKVRFCGFGGWYFEDDGEKDVNTRQVIGRRREVSSKQERGVQRRKRLVDSTHHFLETQDPQEISFKAIAKHAEVPEGSAYHFFANKYDLFSAVAIELGKLFVEEISKPFSEEEICSWQDFLMATINRSTGIYRSNPVARKVLLGSTMPSEVKHADEESIEEYVTTIEQQFHKFYEMPSVPNLRMRLFYALTMIDALFALDLSENANLSDEIVEEAKLMMVGYLSNFIPEKLELKNEG